MKYNIVIKESDDIEIQETTCRKPLGCQCHIDCSDPCGYDRYMIQQKVIEHYRQRAKSIADMTNEQFLQCYGFYYDKGE